MTGCYRCVFTPSYLQVIEDEEEGFSGESLVKLHGVGVGRWHLVVERQGGARVPHQVLPVVNKSANKSVDLALYALNFSFINLLLLLINDKFTNHKQGRPSSSKITGPHAGTLYILVLFVLLFTVRFVRTECSLSHSPNSLNCRNFF